MARMQKFGLPRRLAAVVGWLPASALLLLGICLHVAAAAESSKAPADGPLVLNPGQELPKGKWVDVMATVDPDWDAVSGAWRRGAWDGLSGTWRPQGSDLRATGRGFERIMLPVEIEGGYELKVEFSRLAGMSSVEIAFPIGKRNCMMSLAALQQSAHGLSRVNGRDVGDRDNPAIWRPGTLINNRRYSALISVRLEGDKAKVDVTLDGHPIISWKGRQESLDVLPIWSLPKPYRPGFAGHNTDVVFYSALVRVTDGKARMAPPHVPPAIDLNDGHWIDLLKDVNPDRDAIEGRWLKVGRRIEVAPVSQAAKCVRLMLPRSVEGSYDLLAEFTRTKGTDSAMLALPVGSRQCNLVFSAYAGQDGGLEAIDGLGVHKENNPALRHPNSLVNGKEYRVLAQVRTRDDNAVIDTWLDGKPFVHWAGKQSSLSTSKGWELPERWHVGVGAYESAVTFHTVRLRPVGGDAVETK
jgi:hypothetical protein